MRFHGRCWTHVLSMPRASDRTLRTAAFVSCITMHHRAFDPSLTVRTIATMPARTVSDSLGQTFITAARSGSATTIGAACAPDSAPPCSESVVVSGKS
jgi:hypothetical protein